MQYRPTTPLIPLLCLLLCTQCFPSPRPRGDADYLGGDKDFRLVRNEHLKKVLGELKKGKKDNVNTKDDAGKAPIHLVCEEQLFDSDELVKALKFLLDNEANVDERNEEKKTPLIMLCEERNLRAGEKARKLLLDRGADPNAQDEDGNTALIKLLEINTYGDMSKSIKPLITPKTDFTLKNNDGSHPLPLAIQIKNDTYRKKAWKLIMDTMKANAPSPRMSQDAFNKLSEDLFHIEQSGRYFKLGNMEDDEKHEFRSKFYEVQAAWVATS
ncbi:MAG: ankyrin repeat domain-containing protein [Roseivirga sp.]